MKDNMSCDLARFFQIRTSDGSPQSIPSSKIRNYIYDERKLSPLKADDFIHIFSSGRIHSEKSFTIHAEDLPFPLIVRVREGMLRFLIDGQEVIASVKSPLMIGKSTFSIETLSEGLRADFLILAGKPVEYYASLDSYHTVRPLVGSRTVFISSIVDTAFSFRANPGIRDLLMMNQSLTTMITEFCLPGQALCESGDSLPVYIRDMWNLIHEKYSSPFSLSHCEELFGVSRYRLCREYSQAYGISPVQDLNRCRIEKARELLGFTNLKIQEISARCGYDTPTHFINMFKRECGMTPRDYRKSSLYH